MPRQLPKAAVQLVFLLAPALAHAQSCTPPESREAFANLTVAEVAPGVAKVHFADPECDPGSRKSCQLKAYVMPGDVVLLSDILDASACATFVNGKGQTTTGLLPNNRLQAPRSKPSETARDLLGRWSRTEAKIEIKPKGRDGTLAFEGNATWGAHDPARVARGGVNMGDFSFDMKPNKNAVDVSLATDAKGDTQAVPREKGDPTDCQVAMIALPPYLAVQDNRMCGGVNVTFTGIYRRLQR